MPIISVSGLDGAGKTSVVETVVELAQRDGTRVVRWWGGWNHFEMIPFPALMGAVRENIISRNSSRRRSTVPSQSIASSDHFKNHLFRTLVAVDYVASANLRLGKLTRRHDIVICDRYAMDLAVGMTDGAEIRSESLALIQRLYELLPSPSVEILLDLPANLALERRTDVHSVDVMECRRLRYLAVARFRRAIIVDATKPITTIVNEVMSWLQK